MFFLLFTVTYVVGDGVEIDYALVADPNFTHPGVIIFDNKVMSDSLLAG